MEKWITQLSPCPSTKPPGFPVQSLCGHFVPPDGWVEARRIIYDHELIVIGSGEFEIQLDSETISCGPNTFCIVPPGVWHTTVCRRAGRRFYVHFDWEPLSVPPQAPVMTFYPGQPAREYLRQAPSGVPLELLHGEVVASSRIYSLMERLEWMLGSPDPLEQLASRGVLWEILLRLLGSDPGPTAFTGTHQEALAHQVRSALEQTLATPQEPVSIYALLRRQGYSYEHLARIFRQQYGLSPVAYLHAVRIERARVLLRQSTLTVAAIANALGYQDSIYFTRLFKRHTAQSPAQYRKKHRAGL